MYNSDLCDEFEFCHNDNYKGICLQDGPVDEDDQQANENGLDNLNRDNEEGLEDRFDKYKFDEFIDKLRRARYQEPKDYLKSDNDEKADCIRDLDAKYGDYKNDADYDAYWNLLKIVCEEYVSNGNQPRIPLVDGDNDGKPDLKYYLNLREEVKPREERFVVEPDGEEEPNLELAADPDADALKGESLDEKLKEINENLDEAELYARERAKNKKLDQKKPGPVLFNNRYVIDDDLDETEEGRFGEDDNKFKRFDESRILKPSAGSLQFDGDDDQSTDIFKRKAGFTNPSPPTDHKPVEEGAVRVELDPQKKVQLIEPTEPGEKNSPFVAVDSSYAYIYFLKERHPKRSNAQPEQSDPAIDQLPGEQNQEYRQILNNEQLMEVDDIQVCGLVFEFQGLIASG